MKLALASAFLLAAPFLTATPVYYSVVGTIVGIPETIQASVRVPDFVDNLLNGYYEATGPAILACNGGYDPLQPCQVVNIISAVDLNSPAVIKQITVIILNGPNRYQLNDHAEFFFLNVPVAQFGSFISNRGTFSLMISPTAITPEPSSTSLLTVGLLGGAVIACSSCIRSRVELARFNSHKFTVH